jgi:hypothetical protein
VLEAEVIVKMPGAVLLDDIAERAPGLTPARSGASLRSTPARSGAATAFRGRLRRDVEAALAGVLGEDAVLAQLLS